MARALPDNVHPIFAELYRNLVQQFPPAPQNLYPLPDYGTGLRDLHKMPLASNEREYLYMLLGGTEPGIFILPFTQVNGNWTLNRNVETFDGWVVCYGTYNTAQQARWYCVLIKNPWPNGPRVAGRVIFENSSIPYSGNELKLAMLQSIQNGGAAVELSTALNFVHRPDHGYF